MLIPLLYVAAKKNAFSPKKAKQKWQSVEKNINKVALNKRTVAAMERDMERCVNSVPNLTFSICQI